MTQIQRGQRAVLATVLTAMSLLVTGLVVATPASGQEPIVEAVQFVVKTQDRAAIDAAAATVDAVVVRHVHAQRSLWLIEAQLTVGGASPDALAEASRQFVASIRQHAGVFWAVPAESTVEANPFFAWELDGYPFFAWSDQPDTAVDRYPFLAWSERPGQSVNAYPFFAWSDREDGASERGFDVVQFADLDRAHQAATGSGVVVAVLDTGFEIDHPLLAARLVPGIDLVDGDNDPSDVRDGIDDDQDGATDEAYGHGTYVAGVVAQVAPTAIILPIRVLNAEGKGDLYAVVDGIDEAIERGADVINLSFGTDIDEPGLADAIQRAEAAGVTVIAASGNDATAAPRYPAAYDSVVSVAPYDPVLGEVASFGNLSDWVDVSALGVYTFSSAPQKRYGALSGSSVAAPVVAGQAALLIEVQPGRSPGDVRAAIRQTASSRRSQIRYTRYGLVDIPRSLQVDSAPQPNPGVPPVGNVCSVDNGVVSIITTSEIGWLRRGRQTAAMVIPANPGDSVTIIDANYDNSASYQVVGWRNGGRFSFPCATTVSEHGCLGNQVFTDENGNGFRDDGELFVGDVTVELLTADGATVITSTVTDGNGRYLLCSQPGEYRVRFVEPATGFDGFTIANAAREGRDSDAGSNGVTIDTFQIISGETNWQVDAGLVPGVPVAAPAIDLVKKIEGDDANVAPGPEFHVGDVVEITYDVTNTGNVDLVNVVVDDATVGIISCPADTLAVGESFRCSITETLIEELTFFSPIFMEAEARGSFQTEVVRDDDPINFTVVEPLGIVECGFSVGRGVLSLRTDQNPVFLNAQYLVHQGGESSPSLVLEADDAQTRLDFQGMFYELAWFGLPRLTSIEVTVTPVYSVPGSSELKTGAKTVCSRYSSPIGLDIDQSGAVERITADVEFDFDADGAVETASEWFAPTEGILFDATIDGPLTGEHLFGDQGGLFRDGYAKLQQRDLNADRMVSGAELNGLAIWRDANTNGRLDRGEQSKLSAHGIVAMSTSHTNMISSATLANGDIMITEDLWFPVTPTVSQVLRNLLTSTIIALAASAAVIQYRRSRTDTGETLKVS